MEEEKAAAYYDELVLKGGGAARFKQGLGYGSKPSEPRAERSIPTSMSNFVRELSPGKAGLLQKEIRIDNIRDKLKKRDNVPRNLGRSDKRSRSSSPEIARSSAAEEVKKAHGNDGSRSPQRGRRKGERRDESRSPRPRSRSRSRDRGRHRRSGLRSRSHERGRHRRSRSRSSSREHRKEHRKEHRRGFYESRRSRSPRRSGRREISYHGHRRRERSRSLDRKRGDRSKSPGSSDRRTKPQRGSNVAADTRDYSSLIPGFDDMTPAQKVKAKMRLQLSETVVKDNAKGVTGEWERFDFDKTAPLDDDAKLDGLGDDTGAPDDTVFLKHTGSTFYASVNQAKREADIQAAHEAAMFGVPTPTEPEILKHQSSRSHNTTTSRTEDESAEGKAPGSSVLSDEVLKMQQQSSWQERARRLREERAAAGKS